MSITQGAKAVLTGKNNESLVKEFFNNENIIQLDKKDIQISIFKSGDTSLEDGMYVISQCAFKLDTDFSNKKINAIFNDFTIEDYFSGTKERTRSYIPDNIVFKVEDNKITKLYFVEVKSKMSTGSDHEKYLNISRKYKTLKDNGYIFTNLIIVFGGMLDVKLGTYKDNREAMTEKVRSVAGAGEVRSCFEGVIDGISSFNLMEETQITFVSSLVNGDFNIGN